MNRVAAAGLCLLGLSVPASAQDSGQAAAPPAVATVLPPIAGPDDESVPLIVIDAGHGGFDPGAIAPASGLKEKDLTLQLARSFKTAMIAAGFRVALTRDDDRFLVLQERYRIAEKLRATLFISIHTDSIGDGSRRGAGVYTLSAVASDREAAKFSQRESDRSIAGIDLSREDSEVSDILYSIVQNSTLMRSGKFADMLLSRIRAVMPVPTIGHRFASLLILKSPEVPSILLEAGYISNPQDVAWLAQVSNRQRFAAVVAKAAKDFLSRRTP